MPGTVAGVFFCLYTQCVFGARILSSFTESSEDALDLRTVLEVSLDEHDVVDPSSSVVLLELDGVRGLDQASVTLQAELSFNSPQTIWKRQLMGYFPANVYTDDVSQCNELRAPYMTDDGLSTSNLWREWYSSALQEDDAVTWNTRTTIEANLGGGTRRRGLLQSLPGVGNITLFDRNQAFATLTFEGLSLEVRNFKAREECNRKYARFVGEDASGNLEWDLFCSEIALNCGFDYYAICEYSNCAEQPTCDPDSYNLLTQLCVNGEAVSLSGATGLYNLEGVGNVGSSEDCLYTSQKTNIQAELAASKFGRVFALAGNAFNALFEDQREAQKQRNNMERTVQDARRRLNATRENLMRLTVDAEELWDSTLNYETEIAQTFNRFLEDFLGQKESLQQEWRAGFSQALTDAAENADENIVESALLFGMLSALDVIAVDQGDMIADATEEIDSLLRDARVALRNVNDVRVERENQRAATELVWAYSTFLSNFLRDASGLRWKWWRQKGSRPKGTVSLRGDALDPWHRFTLVQQHDWASPHTDAASESEWAWSQDPWIQLLREQQALTPSAPADPTGYKRHMDDRLGNWLDLTTFEFYVSPEYLLDTIDTWFTFNDLKALIGPPGCFPPEVEGGTGGLKPLPEGYTEYCRGWVIVRRDRCYRGAEPYWQKPLNSSHEAFISITDDPRFGDTTDEMNACVDHSSGAVDVQTEFFFDSTTRDLAESSANANSLTLLPKDELVDSSTVFDTYLRLLCQTPVASTSYFNTGIFGFNNSGRVGPFSHVAPSGSTEFCGTFESQMEVQSVQQNSLTLPYLVYKSGQLATQALSLTVQTQWEIDRFGLMPENMVGQRVPFVTPYHRSHRPPSLRGFESSDEQMFMPNKEPLDALPILFPYKCVRYQLGFTSPFMQPLWLIQRQETSQEVGVLVRTPDGQVLQNYTQNIQAERTGSAARLPNEFLLAGYLAWAHHNDQGPGGRAEPRSTVPDFQPEDLSAELDPVLREGKATYPLFFLQKEQTGSTTQLSYTDPEELEPTTNLLLDQDQVVPWSLDECGTAELAEPDCTQSFFMAPQLLPEDAEERWAAQNNLAYLDFAKVGAATGAVRRELEQNQLTGEAGCKPVVGKPAVTNGTWCTFLDAEHLQKPPGAGITLDNTPDGLFVSHARQWSSVLQFVVSGRALDLLTRGSALYPPGERCPSNNYLQLQPNTQSADGTSEWVVKIGNADPARSLTMNLVFAATGEPGANGSAPVDLVWTAPEAWAAVRANCRQGLSSRVVYSNLLVPAAEQVSILLPSECYPATLRFDLVLGGPSTKTCATYALQELNTRSAVIPEEPAESAWNPNFFQDSVIANPKTHTAEAQYPARATTSELEDLLVIEARTQLRLLTLQRSLVESLTGLCVGEGDSSASLGMNSTEELGENATVPRPQVAEKNCTGAVAAVLNQYGFDSGTTRAATNAFWLELTRVDPDRFSLDSLGDEQEDPAANDFADVIDRLNALLQDQKERDENIDGLLDLIQDQIDLIDSNLEELRESEESLARLNREASAAFEKAVAFLKNKGPYQDVLASVENSMIKTTVDADNYTVVIIKPVDWNGWRCGFFGADVVCEILNAILDFFNKDPEKCYFLWFTKFDISSLVFPKKNKDDSFGKKAFKIRPFGGDLVCFLINAIFALVTCIVVLVVTLALFKAFLACGVKGCVRKKT